MDAGAGAERLEVNLETRSGAVIRDAARLRVSGTSSTGVAFEAAPIQECPNPEPARGANRGSHGPSPQNCRRSPIWKRRGPGVFVLPPPPSYELGVNNMKLLAVKVVTGAPQFG